MGFLARTSGSASRTVAIVLFAGFLMLAAESSQAARHGDRRSRVGGREFMGDRRAYRGGESWYGGGRREPAFRGRDRGRGDQAYGGRGRAYARGGLSWIGDGRTDADGGVRSYGAVRSFGGGTRCYGGARDHGTCGYGYVQPRSVIRVGIGLGVPYYRPPAYRYDVEPYPAEGAGPSVNTPGPPPPGEAEPGPSVITPDQPPPIGTDPGAQVDVANEPPAGCYYYDRFCDRRFSNLDEYTEHVESQDHPKTIEVIRQDSGGRLRTLEFVGGVWRVQR
jgi:hypothetical protein